MIVWTAPRVRAKMGHNTICFVDRHILNHQPYCAFALAGCGFRGIPELAEAFWDCTDLRVFLCTDPMLIALLVLLCDGSCFFELPQLRIPFGF